MNTPRLLFLLSLVLLAFNAQGALPFDWAAISDEELALTQCPSDPKAPAEVIECREEWCDGLRLIYKRIKIYDPSSELLEGLIRIEYIGRNAAPDLYLRQTHSDRSVANYERSDFTPGVAYRTDWYRVQQLSFSIPDLRAGDVIELQDRRFIETFFGDLLGGFCQGPIPVRRYVVTLRLLDGLAGLKRRMAEETGGAILIGYNMQAKVTGANDRWTLEVENLPAYVEEPCGPSELDTCAWFSIPSDGVRASLRYDTFDSNFVARRIWDLVSEFKVGPRIGTWVSEQVREESSDAAKLERLHEWCRLEVRNFRHVRTPEMKKIQGEWAENWEWGPDDTFKQRAGASDDINLLFCGMAIAAGFEARPFLCSSRDFGLNMPTLKLGSGGCEMIVAVKVGGQWRYFNPGDPYMPCGLPGSDMEGSLGQLLALNKEEVKTVEDLQVPVSASSQSKLTRKARLQVDELGTLRGSIVCEWTGYKATALKRRCHELSPERAQEVLLEELKALLPNARIDGVNAEHWGDLEFPVRLSCSIELSGYADSVGDRLLLCLNPFAKNQKSPFVAEERQALIAFPHAGSLSDEVYLEIPEGYEPEGMTAPSTVKDSMRVVAGLNSLRYSPSQRTLILASTQLECPGNWLVFKKEAYPYIRSMFDKVITARRHQAVLKRVEPVQTAAAPVGTPQS